MGEIRNRIHGIVWQHVAAQIEYVHRVGELLEISSTSGSTWIGRGNPTARVESLEFTNSFTNSVLKKLLRQRSVVGNRLDDGVLVHSWNPRKSLAEEVVDNLMPLDVPKLGVSS